jgi:molybdate transport system substrate-binding protein
MRTRIEVVFFCLLATTIPSIAQELTVAAAADLHETMSEIGSHFQSQSGIRVKVIYGSSEDFYQQILNGAPFDMFLSANADYPRKIASAGLARPDSYYEYARGKLVLITRANSTLDVQQGLKLLLNPAVNKISIADPNHAPYGQAAVAALKTENLYEIVSPKIVRGENVSQAASFVLSGAAEVGIVAFSLIASPENSSQVRYREIPAGDYPPIQQACIVLRSAKNQKSAMQFESYLRGAEAKEILRRYGFTVPNEESSEANTH